MNHDPFKINEAILDLWRDLKAGEDYIDRLEIRNASLVSERERIEPELEQRCRELNLSLAQQAIQLKQIGELKAEVERYKFTLEEERQIARQDWAGLRCEHDRVKRALEQAEAEVERLRKAGDAVAEQLIYEGYSNDEEPCKAWNAAKEGKPSA